MDNSSGTFILFNYLENCKTCIKKCIEVKCVFHFSLYYCYSKHHFYVINI
jgi:hypothetical protein